MGEKCSKRIGEAEARPAVGTVSKRKSVDENCLEAEEMGWSCKRQR